MPFLLSGRPELFPKLISSRWIWLTFRSTFPSCFVYSSNKIMETVLGRFCAWSIKSSQANTCCIFQTKVQRFSKRIWWKNTHGFYLEMFLDHPRTLLGSCLLPLPLLSKVSSQPHHLLQQKVPMGLGPGRFLHLRQPLLRPQPLFLKVVYSLNHVGFLLSFLHYLLFLVGSNTYTGTSPDRSWW